MSISFMYVRYNSKQELRVSVTKASFKQQRYEIRNKRAMYQNTSLAYKVKDIDKKISMVKELAIMQ